MADNKGSSSNPAKGLVAHLDQNRSLQQDRVVGSSSAPPAGSQSFRSRPSGPSPAILDAAFADFTNHARGTQLGALPMGPGNSISTAPGAPDFRYSANTAWANEFLHLHNQPRPDPRALAAHLREGSRLHRPNQSNLEGDQTHPDASVLAWPFPDEPLAIDPAQRQLDFNMVNRQNPAMGFARVIPPTEQYAMYPADRISDEARLADNAEQAMEAAFAAYDQDFQGAMDGWMKADGLDGLETHVQNIRMMEEMKLQDEVTGQSGLTTDSPSTKPDVPSANKAVYDYAMMKHAGDIVTTLTNNGSAETKAKMNGSSFQGLMRAVASGKAAVVDDNFIDTSTGEVIHDLVELSGVKSNQEPSDTGNGPHTVGANDGVAVDSTDSKGKGKMKSLQEQEQEQERAGRPA